MPVQQIAVLSSKPGQMDNPGVDVLQAEGGALLDLPRADPIEMAGETTIPLGEMTGDIETDVDKCDLEVQNVTESAINASGDTMHGPHVLVDAVIVTDRPCTQADHVTSLREAQDDVDSVNPAGHDSDTQSPAKRDSPTGGGQTDKRLATTRNGKSSKKEKPTPFKKKDSIAKETLHPNSPTPMSTERCDSSLSNSSADVCRICQCDTCEIQNDSPLVAPCLCIGSLRYIHQACLQKWIKSSDKMSCELCQYEYLMTKKTKPFREWERLDMSPAERRKVVCSVTFHVIAITCVVWSLYVLIDRTTEEVEAGSLLWPFWTKLIVVAIGFTGGVVFMYVQCKMYLTLCKKWRMYNKVIIISSITDLQRERATREGQAKKNEKEAQLEAGGGQVTNFDVFNIVNETESV